MEITEEKVMAINEILTNYVNRSALYYEVIYSKNKALHLKKHVFFRTRSNSSCLNAKERRNSYLLELVTEEDHKHFLLDKKCRHILHGKKDNLFRHSIYA